MDRNEGKVRYEMMRKLRVIVRVDVYGGESWTRILLNVGLVEGSVGAIGSKEFSMSSKLSDRLGEWQKR